jgi:DNA polymerase III epsilon subunit family exonuclease
MTTVPVACIDVETSGASSEWGDRIIEVGIVRYENGVKVGEYGHLVDPRRHISAGVTVLTGITQAMCDGQPTFAEQAPRIIELLSGAAILGHNIPFDLSFLIRELRGIGKDVQQIFPDAPVLDTVRIARRRFGRGGNGLSRLARRLGYEPAVAHRALPDAQTTAIVFDQLLQPVGGWLTLLCDVMREQGGPMGMATPSSSKSLLPLELEEALEMRRPVLLEYLDARQARTERVIEPLEIRRSGGEMLLVAFCRLRNNRRTFKLDRIVQLKRMESEEFSGTLTSGETGQGSAASV